MEQPEFITVKVKSMDEAIVEFRLSPKDKILDLKNLIKDVSRKIWAAKKTQILGTQSAPQAIKDRIYGPSDSRRLDARVL